MRKISNPLWTLAPLAAHQRERCRAIMAASWASIARAPPRPLDETDFDRQTAGEEIWTAADASGAIIGFVSIWRADAFIHHLFVAPDHQGRGVGEALLTLALEALGGRAALKCSDMNTRAHRFYKRMGGRPGERGIDAFGPWTRLEFGAG